MESASLPILQFGQQMVQGQVKWDCNDNGHEKLWAIKMRWSWTPNTEGIVELEWPRRAFYD